MQQLKDNPTENASRFRKSLNNSVEPVIVLSPEECLATVIEMKLTQRQYKKLRQKQKRQNAKIFCSWEDILKAKKHCRPENIDSTSKIGEVSVPLQNVIDHQISNILDYPEVREKCDRLIQSGRDFQITLYGKYGADSTNSKTLYHTADSGDYLPRKSTMY